MKTLLAALLCLLTLPSAYGQAWPRNPQTGKVEFRGVLPWPAGVKTEVQRRALVRCLEAGESFGVEGLG